MHVNVWLDALLSILCLYVFVSKGKVLPILSADMYICIISSGQVPTQPPLLS
jgi:hypothetical protein